MLKTQQNTLTNSLLPQPNKNFLESNSISMSISTLNWQLPFQFNANPQPPSLHRTTTRATKISAVLSDPHVLRLAETLEDSTTTTPQTPLLQKLRNNSSNSLLSTPWPSRKDEPFRFTDTSFIKNSTIQPTLPFIPEKIQSFSLFKDNILPNLSIVDGYLVDSLSDLSDLPEQVFVGLLSNLSDTLIVDRISSYVDDFKGDLFSSLNGVGASDLIVVYVPEGCKVEKPLRLRFVSVSGSANVLMVSSPRVLVVVEKGGEVGIVEEFDCLEDGEEEKCYWCNSVLQVIVGEGAAVRHSYVQTQSLGAAHVKWTSVLQEKTSVYQLVEVSTGGKLSRHNVHVQQVGPDTETDLSTFHLSISEQLQDLHSKLVLDHPRGVSRQLHKCIIAHSQGQAVFDGNVQVNREAQQTDAGQLTRSLLLEPRATVNVKPNLQIIADDVKCSHGAAISDFEEDQIFYFQARGIDREAARKALIFSFASEVIQRFPDASVQKKVVGLIKKLLDSTLH